MPNAELSPLQYPDMLGAYLRGRAAPEQQQLQQQQIQAGQMNMDQLRQAMEYRQKYAQMAEAAQNAPQAESAQGPASDDAWGPGAILGTNVPHSAISSQAREYMSIAMGHDPAEAHIHEVNAQEAQQKAQREQGAMQILDPTNPKNAMPVLIGLANMREGSAQTLKNRPDLLAQWEDHARHNGVDPADLYSTEPGVADRAVSQVARQTAFPTLAQFGKEGLLNKAETPITPYQQEEIGFKKQELGMERRRLALAEREQQAGGKPPSGYEADPAHPGGLRPIAGGPADPDSKAAPGLDSRSGVMFQRVVNSASAANAAMRNIMELPITTSTGLFGNAQTGTSLLGSVRSVMSQKITSQEAQDLKTMIAGVSRNLATIETAGLAPNGSLTHSMDSITIGEGDTQLTKLRKMAEMRQIITENLRPQLSNPKLAPTQRDVVNQIIGNAEKAVPFTQSDITKFEQSKNKSATIMDFAKGKGLAKAAHPTEIQSLLDKYK